MRWAKFIAAAIFLLPPLSFARAADLPTLKGPATFAPPPADWGGFYAGLNAGGLEALDHGDPFCVNPFGTVNGFGCSFEADRPLVSRPFGLIGGAEIGYNWQFNRYVAGIEADFQGTTANGSHTLTTINLASGAPDQDQVSSRLDYLGTVRGRLGVAVLDPLLLYATCDGRPRLWRRASVFHLFGPDACSARRLLSIDNVFRAAWLDSGRRVRICLRAALDGEAGRSLL